MKDIELGNRYHWHRRDGKRHERIDIYCKLAEIHEKAGRIADALDAYKQCVHLNPNDAEVRENIKCLEPH